jgi:hypothetical protein
MDVRLAVLLLVLVCAGCASTTGIAPEDVATFPVTHTAYEAGEVPPTPAAAPAVRSIATGIALSPFAAQEDGTPVIPPQAPAEPAKSSETEDLERRVSQLEREVDEVKSKTGHSIALVGGIGRTERDEDDDWEPVDEVETYWLDFLLGPSGGLGIEFSAMYGREKEDGFKKWMAAPAAGLRFTLGRGWFQPYVAGGYEAEYANVDPPGRTGLRDQSSWAYGPYVRAGFNLSLTRDSRIFIGADARWGLIGGEHDFHRDFEPDADYVRYSAFLGFRF